MSDTKHFVHLYTSIEVYQSGMIKLLLTNITFFLIFVKTLKIK